MLFEVECRSGVGNSTVYAPRTPDTRPGILLLHGSEGGFAGWSHVWALSFAHAGFVAMPWAYCKGGGPWGAGDIHDAHLDKTETALAWLRTARGVSGRVGIYGAS